MKILFILIIFSSNIVLSQCNYFSNNSIVFGGDSPSFEFEIPEGIFVNSITLEVKNFNVSNNNCYFRSRARSFSNLETITFDNNGIFEINIDSNASITELTNTIENIQIETGFTLDDQEVGDSLSFEWKIEIQASGNLSPGVAIENLNFNEELSDNLAIPTFIGPINSGINTISGIVDLNIQGEGVTLYPDADFDGYGDVNSLPLTINACSQFSDCYISSSPNNEDCDDTNDNINPEIGNCPGINTVEGHLYYNKNNDDCVTTIPIQNQLVTVTSNNIRYSTNTNELGYYSIMMENKENYSVTIENLPSNLVTPDEYIGVFSDFNNTDVVNFCIQGVVYDDVGVIILPIDEARPGFVALHNIVYYNNGTSEVSGEITLEFDNIIQNEELIFPSYNQIDGNKMTWTFSDLQPYETRVIYADFKILPPPTVNGDDILTYTASISSVNLDSNPDDNNFVLEQLVVNSFDPNDKRVTQGESIYIDEIDNYLDYMVRFQNTGTASAINVVIEDTLDPNLDWSSLEMVSASHDYELKIVDGNKIEFIFENIFLPDSTTDERASNGYVAFKIKPKADVMLGDVINGKADIYFDFNLPIVTNVVSTQVIERPTFSSLDNFANTIDILKIFPVPIKNNKLYVKNNSDIDILKTSFIMLSGKIIDTIIITKSKNEIVLDTSNISSGMFF